MVVVELEVTAAGPQAHFDAGQRGCPSVGARQAVFEASVAPGDYPAAAGPPWTRTSRSRSPMFNRTREDQLRGVATGNLTEDVDPIAAHVMTAATYLGYAVFREHFARDICIMPEELESRGVSHVRPALIGVNSVVPLTLRIQCSPARSRRCSIATLLIVPASDAARFGHLAAPAWAYAGVVRSRRQLRAGRPRRGVGRAPGAIVVSVTAALLSVACTAPDLGTALQPDARTVAASITEEGLRARLEELAQATQGSDRFRSVGSPGYDACSGSRRTGTGCRGLVGGLRPLRRCELRR